MSEAAPLSSKQKIILYVILFFTIAPILFYVYVVIATLGRLTLSDYLCILLNVVMYFSIAKYTIDYFFKHKDVSLEMVLLRYAASLASVVINTDGEHDPSFTLAVVNLLLIPYLAGSVKRPKKTVCVLFLVVLLASIGIAVFRITDVNAVDQFSLGRTVFCMNASNSAFQWLLFTCLFFLRLKITKPEQA